MKVLIADKMSKNTVTELEKLGCKCTVSPGIGEAGLPEAIVGHDVLIVRSTKVSAKTIEAGNKLSLIIRAGAGVNTIDLDTASRRGVHVTNCPGKNTEAVAELVIGLLIAADRRIVAATCDLRNGEWKKGEYGKARGLKSRVLGVIGLGSIGKAVISRAKALEMRVLAWSRSLTPEMAAEMEVEYADSPMKIAELSDAVTLHVAYKKPDTHHLIDEKFLSKMKQGAILINASRGEVVDTMALKKAIKEKGLRVGLDVFEDEPKGSAEAFADKELADLVIGTPHIGASTDQASEAIADEAVRIVNSMIETGMPVNVVNVRAKTTATHGMVIRHYNRVGVLANVFSSLKSQGINIEEMQNVIFEGGVAAVCTLKLDKAPLQPVVDGLASSPDMIQVSTY